MENFEEQVQIFSENRFVRVYELNNSVFTVGLLFTTELLIALRCPFFLAKISEDDISLCLSLSSGFYFRSVNAAGRIDIFCFLTEKDFFLGESMDD